MSDPSSRQVNPDRVVFFGVILEEWVKHLRRSLVILKPDLLCLALALERCSDQLRKEAAEVEPGELPSQLPGEL